MIITSRDQIDNKRVLCMTSIGGSPIHEGHVRLLNDCKKRVYGHFLFHRDPTQFYIERHVQEQIQLLVIVNCDEFLIRKHGFSFQSEDARAEILDSFKNVDYTYIHKSDTQTIHDCIHYFQPHYLLKGGDRSSDSSMPSVELEACKCYGTQIIYGVGGTEKASSSSDLIKRAVSHYSIKLQEELLAYQFEYNRLAQRFDDMQKENEFENF